MSVGILALLGSVLIVFFLIGSVIILTARSRNKGLNPVNQDEGGKRMIKTVYTYLILFATLMMTIGGSIAAFMAVADLVSPPGYYMSYDEYKRNGVYIKESAASNPSQTPAQVKSEEELKKDYESAVAEEKNRARDRALNSLIKSFGWIVIPLPVFLYYQRRLKKEKI